MAIDMEKKRLDKNFYDNRDLIKSILGVGESYDVFGHDITFAGKDATVFFVQGFIKDDVLTFLLRLLVDVEQSPSPTAITGSPASRASRR